MADPPVGPYPGTILQDNTSVPGCQYTYQIDPDGSVWSWTCHPEGCPPPPDGGGYDEPRFVSFDPTSSDGQGTGTLTIYGEGLTGTVPAAPFVLESAVVAAYDYNNGGTITVTGTGFLDPTHPMDALVIEDASQAGGTPTSVADTEWVQDIYGLLDAGPQALYATDSTSMWRSNTITVVIP